MDLKLSAQYSDCETPISIISKILANGDPIRFEQIESDFKSLRFDKVKDLANASLGKGCEMKSLGVDSITELSNAIKIFDQRRRYVEQLEDAKWEYVREQYEETQKICHDLLIKKPNDVKVLILLSASYYCSGEFTEYLKYLKIAQEIDPNSIEVLFSTGVNFYAYGNFKEASIYLIEAFKKDSVINAKKMIQLAKLMTLIDSNHQAEEIYKIILLYFPDLYIERNLYANVLISLNKLEEAKNQYLLALKTAPRNANTFNNLGNLYDRMNKINDAIDCYKTALEFDSALPKTWNNLGIQYCKLKEYQNAIDCFQNAYELCSEDIIIDILKNLGIVYFNQKKWLLFVDTYEQIWKLKPDDLDTNLRLGLVYFYQLNSYKKAVKYFENLQKNNPLNDEFLTYAIVVYKKQGKTKRAYEIAISLGDMYNEQKDYEKAVKTYFWALQFKPKNIFGHMKLGNVLYSQGCLEMALDRYKYAISLKVHFPIGYYNCGRIYEKMNNPRKAMEYYKLAYSLDTGNSNYSNKMIFFQKKLGYFDEK